MATPDIASWSPKNNTLETGSFAALRSPARCFGSSPVNGRRQASEHVSKVPTARHSLVSRNRLVNYCLLLNESFVAMVSFRSLRLNMAETVVRFIGALIQAALELFTQYTGKKVLSLWGRKVEPIYRIARWLGRLERRRPSVDRDCCSNCSKAIERSARVTTRPGRTGNQQDDAKVMAACRRPQPDALFRFALTAALQNRFHCPGQSAKKPSGEKARISIIRFLVTETQSFFK